VLGKKSRKKEDTRPTEMKIVLTFFATRH